MQLLQGKAPRQMLLEQISQKSLCLKDQSGVAPCLGLVRVGAKPDDMAYEGQIKRCLEKCHMQVRTTCLPEDCSEADLYAVLSALNQDPEIHGILLFRPLPPHLPQHFIPNTYCSLVKDIDGMTPSAAANLYLGLEADKATSYPCTAEAIFHLLDYYNIDLVGKQVVVVGRSPVIGRPAALLALQRHATVTVCHSRTQNLPQICQMADVLILALGHRDVISPSHLRPNQVVIDVGIHVLEDGQLVGDLYRSDIPLSAWPEGLQISPVPGGLGSVTTAVLALHLIHAAEQQVQSEKQKV